jgi:hypothetical protein
LENDLYKERDNLKDIKLDNQSLKEQVELLEQALRDFSCSSSGNYEDTYEAVLRSEFELMR